MLVKHRPHCASSSILRPLHLVQPQALLFSSCLITLCLRQGEAVGSMCSWIEEVDAQGQGIKDDNANAHDVSGDCGAASRSSASRIHHNLPTLPDKTLQSAYMRQYADFSLQPVGISSLHRPHTIYTLPTTHENSFPPSHHAGLTPGCAAQRLHHRPDLGLHHW